MTNSITPAIKAKSPRPSETKTSSGKSGLITPDIISKLPRVVLILATTLPKEEVRRLKQWFRQNVDPQILLDIRRDAKIIGGCQIIWRGFEGDFSLRRKFEKSYKAP